MPTTYTSSPSADRRAIDGSGSSQRSTISSESGSSASSSAGCGVCADRSWPGRTPPKSFVTRWPSGSTTKLLYGWCRGSVRDASAREVGSEPVGVVAEHDVQRAVGVRGETTRPGGPAGQVVGAPEHLERRRVDLLDPADRVGPGRVPQEVGLARIAQHEHRRRDHFAGLDADRAGLERGPATRCAGTDSCGDRRPRRASSTASSRDRPSPAVP